MVLTVKTLSSFSSSSIAIRSGPEEEVLMRGEGEEAGVNRSISWSK